MAPATSWLTRAWVDAGVDMDKLEARRALYVVQCFRWLAEYIEALGPVLQSDGVAVVLRLLQHWQARPTWLPDLVAYTSALLAHRRYTSCSRHRRSAEVGNTLAWSCDEACKPASLMQDCHLPARALSLAVPPHFSQAGNALHLGALCAAARSACRAITGV